MWVPGILPCVTLYVMQSVEIRLDQTRALLMSFVSAARQAKSEKVWRALRAAKTDTRSWTPRSAHPREAGDPGATCQELPVCFSSGSHLSREPTDHWSVPPRSTTPPPRAP